jgi:hypothetical protein
VSNSTITLSAVLRSISDLATEDKIFSFKEVKDFSSRNIATTEVKSSV